MPIVLQDLVQMCSKGGYMEYYKCLINYRYYDSMYQECISYVNKKGNFYIAIMSIVENFGIRAQRAE